MKKTSIPKKVHVKEDLLREYRFDYSKAKPNRFAAEMPAETIAVVLEPDIAAVFSERSLPGEARLTSHECLRRHACLGVFTGSFCGSKMG